MKIYNIHPNDDSFGNKARNLIKLRELGYNVPEFVVLSGEYLEWLFRMSKQIRKEQIKKIQRDISDGLVSIRSSPQQSMPGMMETELNFNCSDGVLFEEKIKEIYNSFQSHKAILYRKIKKIPEIYPGVIIQRMVFGNRDEGSGSGVMFTRNALGDIDNPTIEFAWGRQGIEIVDNSIDIDDFDELSGNWIDELKMLAKKLETDFIYPQDVEFTIESGELFILQTRKFQVGSLVDLEILCNLYKTNKIGKHEFQSELEIIGDKSWKQLKKEPNDILFVGTPICSGIVEGYLGKEILVTDKITNEDLDKLSKVDGLITKEGSLTAHVANICRILGKPYVVYPHNIEFKGKIILDGQSGKVYVYENNCIELINKETLCAVLADA